MRLKSGEAVIDKEKPFLHDALKRESAADSLGELVLSASESLVMCIDAPWGQGKTTFLKMWVQSLRNQNVPTLYYNAWANDFTEDPLVSLLGELSIAVESLRLPSDKSKIDEYLKRSKKIGGSLIKRSLPAIAKIATAGIVDLDELTEQALGELSEKITAEQLERYQESQLSIISFKESLSALATSMTEGDEPKPLVFVIDELDRCRPNFAINLLETAKHFFNVPNIVFVLAVDKKQLGSSFKSIYGSGLDIDGYLKRFFDIEYSLPAPQKGDYVKFLFKKFGFVEYFSGKDHSKFGSEEKNTLVMLEKLFSLYDLTLREQDHCCSLLSISIRSTPSDVDLNPGYLCLLIVLKVKDQKLYNHILNTEQKLALVEVLKRHDPVGNLFTEDQGIYLEACIASSGSFESTRAAYKHYEQNQESIRENRVWGLIGNFQNDGKFESLQSVPGKIDFVRQFE